MSVTSRKQKQKEPRFFLYTTINQNETKKLAKAVTNSQARNILAQIFNMTKGGGSSTSVSGVQSKLNELILDFHYNNYYFTKEQNFTNEKLSTVVAIFDYVLHHSLKNKLSDEGSFKIFKRILQRHSLQKPPSCLAIFSQDQARTISQYALKSFYRHYSFYQFIFRPKLELCLQAEESKPIELPERTGLDEHEEADPSTLEILSDYVPKQQVLQKEQKVQEEEELPPKEETKAEALLRMEMEKIQELMNSKLHELDQNVSTKVSSLKK